jgi:hypothetical protein
MDDIAGTLRACGWLDHVLDEAPHMVSALLLMARSVHPCCHVYLD